MDGVHDTNPDHGWIEAVHQQDWIGWSTGQGNQICATTQITYAIVNYSFSGYRTRKQKVEVFTWQSLMILPMISTASRRSNVLVSDVFHLIAMRTKYWYVVPWVA